MVRKRMQAINNDQPDNQENIAEPQVSLSERSEDSRFEIQNLNFLDSSQAIQIDHVPDIYNQAVKDTEDRLGPFVIDLNLG